MGINHVNLLRGYVEKCKDLNEVYKIINNAKYFGICQSPERLFHNLINDISEVLDTDEDFGKFFIE